MNKKEKFAYDIDFGAIMDYVENRFMLVIKDSSVCNFSPKLSNDLWDLFGDVAKFLYFLSLEANLAWRFVDNVVIP